MERGGRAWAVVVEIASLGAGVWVADKVLDDGGATPSWVGRLVASDDGTGRVSVRSPPLW